MATLNEQSADGENDHSDPDWEVHNPFRTFNFTAYLKEELVQSQHKREEDSGRDGQGTFNNRMHTFVTVPKYFEVFMGFGLLQCLDHLLVIYTFLPLRCICTVIRLSFRIPWALIHYGWNSHSESPQDNPPFLYAHELRDLVRFSLLIICTLLLTILDGSVVYHEIRTQSVIKIYIFFNLLEVADRLLSAVCQDALGDLMYTVSKIRRLRNRSTEHCPEADDKNMLALIRDVFLQYCFALVCLSSHCFLMLCQVTTLNVAFNSQHKSLVTVFISNNFVELKGNVFRKIGKTNLFQIACADVRERFHYAIWLLIVVFRNMTDNGWNLADLTDMLSDTACIFMAEVAVDWVKHSFITKFNVIRSDVYKEYTVSIAYDLLLCRQGQNTADYFDLLSRRMGLTPIPLSCLINMMFLQTVRQPRCLYFIVPMVLCALFVLKVTVNLVLMFWAYSHVHAYIEAAQSSERARLKYRSLSLPEKLLKSEDGLAINLKGVPNESKPSVPIQYTGYDQPTRDEEQFEPIVLRHRRIHSETGLNTSNRIASATTELLSAVTSQPQPLVPFEDSIPIVMNLDNSNVSTETGKDDKSITFHENHHLASSLFTSPNRFKEQHPVLSNEITNFVIVGECHHSSSPHSTANHSLVRSSNKGTFPSGSLTCNSCASSIDEINLKKSTDIVSSRSPLSSTLLGSDEDIQQTRPGRLETFESGLDRRKSFSIDFGILSACRHFNVPHEVGNDLASMDQIATEKMSSKDSLRYITSSRQRRVRTVTEGSGTDTTRLHGMFYPLPVMWERNNRESLTENLFLNRTVHSSGHVKQPLSDVDRYAMLEGQIS